MPQRLAQHLIARGLLPARVVDDALKRLARDKGTLDTVLLEMGVISEAGALQAIADVSGLRLVNLADFEPNAEAASLMPLKMARQLGCVPLSLDGNAVHVACTWPVDQAMLKDAGVLLSRRMELWVALECRVRDWQSVLYGEPLDARTQRLLSTLDPSRPAPPAASPPTESVDTEVLERIARGIVEEPVLLSTPRRPAKPPAVIVDEPAPDTDVFGSSEGPFDDVLLGDEPEEASRTSVLDVTAYGRFAKSSLGDTSGGIPLDEASSTRVVDISGYSNFAREVAKHEQVAPPTPTPTPAAPPPIAPAPRISFPGGVLPPRRSAVEAPPPRRSQPEWVQPASMPRPAPVERARPSAPVSRRPTPPEAPAPAQPARVAAPPPADEADFSDVNVELAQMASSPAPAEVPVAVEAVSEAATTQPATASVARPPPAEPPMVSHPSQSLLPEPPGLYASGATEWSLAQARASLKAATHDREALLSVILEYGRRTFEYIGAFAVMRGVAAGWDARGDGDVMALRQLAIPLDAASVFRTVSLTRGSYIGPLPPDQLSQHYLALLGRAPRTVFLWPIEVQSKLLVMLYGDCGARPVSQRRLADFILFCQELPQAFHELILFRRQDPRVAQHLMTPSGGLPDADVTTSPGGEAPVDQDWFSGLLALLTGPDPSERSMAMLELLKTPEASAQALAQAFPGPTGWSRLPVAELPECDELGPIPGALARLGQSGAAALAPLLDVEDSDTRYLALLTAGSLRYPDVVDGVLRGLFDDEPDVSSAARAAAAALRFLPYFQSRLPALREALTGDDALQVSLAARALGVLHDRSSIEALIGLTDNADALCAQSAADALRELTRADFGGDTAGWREWWSQHGQQRRIEWLVEALDAQDFELRLAAIEEVSRTFGDNFGFFADGPLAERAAAVSRWRAVVQSRAELDL